MRSGGRRGRSRDGDASLAVRTRSPASSPAARSRSGACSGSPVGCSPRNVSRGGGRIRVRGAAACGCRQAASPGPNSIRAQPPTTDARPRPARPHLVARTIGTDHGISRFGGELGRGGATRTDGLIPPGVGDRWFPRILPPSLACRSAAACSAGRLLCVLFTVPGRWVRGQLPRWYPNPMYRWEEEERGMGNERDCAYVFFNSRSHKQHRRIICRPNSKFVRKKKGKRLDR